MVVGYQDGFPDLGEIKLEGAATRSEPVSLLAVKTSPPAQTDSRQVTAFKIDSVPRLMSTSQMGTPNVSRKCRVNASISAGYAAEDRVSLSSAGS